MAEKKKNKQKQVGHIEPRALRRMAALLRLLADELERLATLPQPPEAP